MELSSCRKNLQNIKVVVRIRPLTTEEERQNRKPIIDLGYSNQVRIRDKKFDFDHIFHQNSKQNDVYSTIIAPMVEDIFCGYNCTAFAYGQTGSGKTFTMIGENSVNCDVWELNDTAGCIPRAADDIFNQIERFYKMSHYTVRVSFIELYNEDVRDLLTDNDNIVPLSLFIDPRKKEGVYIQNVKEVTVCNGNDVYKILLHGSKKRQTASTLINLQSSRSHTVFTFIINSREENCNGEVVYKTGKLNLVDLAGSENIAKSGAKEMRAVELSNINKSLLTLGRVIHALAEKAQHVPYRESKLTRILQNSLGGSTKTCIIATISPTINSIEETISTLDYAHRARAITNCPEINQEFKRAELVKHLNTQVDALHAELEAARSGVGYYVDPTNYKQLVTDLEKYKDENFVQSDKIKELNTQIKEMESLKEQATKEWEQMLESFEKTNSHLQRIKQKAHEKKIEAAQEQHVAKWVEEHKDELNNLIESLHEKNTGLVKMQNLLHNKLQGLYKVDESYRKITQQSLKYIMRLMEDHSRQAEGLNNTQFKIFQELSKDVSNISADIQKLLDRMSIRMKKNVHERKILIADEIVPKTEEYCNVLEEVVTDTIEQLRNFKYSIKYDNRTVQECLSKITSHLEEADYIINLLSTRKNFEEDIARTDDFLALSSDDDEELIELCPELCAERKQETNEMCLMQNQIKLDLQNVQSFCTQVEAFSRIHLSKTKEFFDKSPVVLELLQESIKLKEDTILNHVSLVIEDLTKHITQIHDYKEMVKRKTMDNDLLFQQEFDKHNDYLRKKDEEVFEQLNRILTEDLPAISECCQPYMQTISTYSDQVKDICNNINEIIVNECLNVVVPIQPEGNTPACERNTFATESLLKKTSREQLLQKFREKVNNGEIEMGPNDSTDSLECSLLQETSMSSSS